MTQPRRVLAGRTYLITRRCSERRFLLNPDRVVTQVFTYALGLATARTGVEVHALIVLGNHYHAVVSDPGQQLPTCMHLLDMLVARALNAHRRRGENFWAPGSYSAVELLGSESVWAKLVYTVCNAVRAGLVKDPLEWPGVRTTPSDMPGQRLRARRPDAFFRESMPEEAALHLTQPPALRHLSPGDYRRELEARVDAEVQAVRERRRRAGQGRVLGVRAVRAQDPLQSAGGTFPSRGLNPRISCRTPGRFRAELEALQAWRQRYRECWETWRRGQRGVAFPAGTYWLRVAFGVRCEAVPGG